MDHSIHIGSSFASMRRLVAAAFLSFITIHTAFSQLLPFRTLTVRDGLISNSTTTLLQDSRGFLWIGSYDGFSRYDGYSFKNISIAEDLPANYVTAFAESRKTPGAMFIGTSGGGIAVFDTKVRSVMKHGNGIVLSLLEDHRGMLWCGTDDEVLRYKQGSTVPQAVLSGTGPVTQIRESSDSLLWIITKRAGLLCLSTADSGYPPVDISSIKRFDPILLSERTGGVRWMTDRNGNFICVRGTSIIRTVITNDPRFHALSLVGVDSLSFWFGTVRGIVQCISNRSGTFDFISYSKANGLPEEIILPVLFDHENNLWMRSFSKGLILLQDERVVTYRMTPAPLVMNNASVKADRSGSVWMTSTEGLMEFRAPGSASSEVFVHHPANEKKYGFANALQFDGEGKLWVKYWHGQIVRYSVSPRNGGASALTVMEEIVPGKDLPNGSYSCFYTDRSGVLYYSIEETGLLAIRSNGSRSGGRIVDTVKGIPVKKISALMEDRDGNIWIGGAHSMLAIIRPGVDHAETIALDPSLQGRTIRSLMQDDAGTVWAGTSRGELVKIAGDTVLSVETDPLLHFTTIWSMSEDRDQIWLGTAKGLFLYQKSSGDISMPSGTIRGIAVYSACITASGRITAVSEEGGHFFEVRPPSVPETAPDIFITSFTVNGIPVDPTSTLELSSEENTCSIEYIGLTFTKQRALQYEYTLVPSDDGVKHITPHRAVTFASLSPGTYRFTVQAVTVRGAGSPSSASVSFTILPPVWKRWWFITGVSFLCGMLAISAYRYRVNRLLEVERLRSRIAMDLHDEIGSTLSGISVMSELLKNEYGTHTERTMNMLDRIGVSSRRMMDAMNDIVWTLNPQHDTMEEFISKVRMVAGEIFEPRGIAYTITVPPPPGPVLAMDPRRQMFLIIKESLHNIGKHSGCTAAEIDITVTGRTLKVRIVDNGKGFELNDTDGGNGLKNMRRRAAAMNALLAIRSSAGNGTSVQVEYPLT